MGCKKPAARMGLLPVDQQLRHIRCSAKREGPLVKHAAPKASRPLLPLTCMSRYMGAPRITTPFFSMVSSAGQQW